MLTVYIDSQMPRLHTTQHAPFNLYL